MKAKLIEINLSTVQKQRKRKRLPYNRTTNLVVIGISILLLLSVIFYLYVSHRSQQLENAKKEYKRIEKPYSEVKKLHDVYDQLTEKKNAIDECKNDWVNWSDKWLELAKLTPGKIYVTDVTISSADKNADLQQMTITGRAIGAVDESIVLQFLDSLKLSPVFSNTFSDMNLSAVYSEGDEKAFSIELFRKPKNAEK